MVPSHRGSDFDLAAMFATRLLFLQMCCKLFLQRKSKKQSMCRSLDRYWGCWTRERASVQLLTRKTEAPVSGLTAFLIWHGQWFVLHAGPDDAPRMEIVSKDQQDGGLPI